MRLRAAGPADARAIAEIYAPFVTDSAVTFELDPPDAAEIGERIEASGGLHPWIVAEEPGGIMGYAYASAFRARRAYRFAVETSVYMRAEAQGSGTGTKLYRALLETLVAQGYAQAVAAIALPNSASIRLHERLGFVQTGTHHDVGWKFGAWHSVGLWQRPLATAGAAPSEILSVSQVGLRLPQED